VRVRTRRLRENRPSGAQARQYFQVVAARLKSCPDTKPVMFVATGRSGCQMLRGSRCSIQDCPRGLKPERSAALTARLKPCPSCENRFVPQRPLVFYLYSNRESKARQYFQVVAARLKSCPDTKPSSHADSFRPYMVEVKNSAAPTALGSSWGLIPSPPGLGLRLADGPPGLDY
jgi:hypothetical protein